jgi:hypothetical protein
MSASIYNQPMANSHELTSARASLEQIAAELARRAGAENAPAVVWPLVCGAAVAARTSVLECASGTLRIEVLDPAWQAPASELYTEYLAKFARIFPEARIQRLEFIASRSAR